MCISRKHLEFLVERNERDHDAELIGYETHLRFEDQSERCLECPLFDNGKQKDMYEECRVRILRFFISGRRDDEKRLATAPAQ